MSIKLAIINTLHKLEHWEDAKTYLSYSSQSHGGTNNMLISPIIYSTDRNKGFVFSALPIIMIEENMLTMHGCSLHSKGIKTVSVIYKTDEDLVLLDKEYGIVDLFDYYGLIEE